jgi:Fe-Mn family superoxide dismutase
MEIEPIELGYKLDALEPHISKETMALHYDKLYKAYVTRVNHCLEKHPKINISVEEMCKWPYDLPADIRQVCRNNAGGVWNHELYFKLISPGGESKPCETITSDLDTYFGGYESFKSLFIATACRHFGSGWCYLCRTYSGDLVITCTDNQNTPMYDYDYYPILGCDLWEHSYLLDRGSKRPEYLKAFFSLLNWSVVEDRWNKK